jgi:uncharacterized GH25 family protein
MKSKIQLLLCLFMLGNIAISSAHALFIKTEAKATQGKSHEVTIFYAEPADGKKEQLKDWWSNTKEFSLWLIQPDGNKKQLEVTPNDDHFIAAFTPSTNGTYHLAIYHDVTETFDATQYQFNASATVNVGAESSKEAPTAYGLFITSASAKNKVNSDLSFTVLDKGKPVAEAPVTFFAPNGWSKTILSNAKGKISFSPLWEGNYLIETYKVDQVENQADFSKKHRIVTTILEVE